MKNYFLLEVGVEELPSRFVESTLTQIKENLEKSLKENRVEFENIEKYGTPRRLTFVINNICDKQSDLEEELKGPSKKISVDADGNFTKPALGFMKSKGLDEANVYFKQVGKDEYLFGTLKQEGQATSEVLKEIVPAAIKGVTFPKAMRWGGKNMRFARPIRWMVALLNDEVLPINLEGIVASNITRGHRFLGRNQIEVFSIEDYFKQLSKNSVVLDQNVRKEAIKAQAEEVAKSLGGEVEIEDDLLEEITYLVEYPTAFYGEFSADYVKLPKEVVTTPMKEHQRNFPVSKDGKLLPYFIAVRNGDKNGIETVKAGNEKVLEARLADALFFYDEDIKKPLESFVENLKTVVFQAKLGTVYDKTLRIEKLASDIINNLDEKEALNDNVPIIRKEMGNLLKVLIALKQPERILEVGTAVGYSSILMSENMPENCHITTIENYDKRIPVAKNNFIRAGVIDKITLIEGDAADVLKTLDGPYDFIFMDAAKGQYINYFPDIMRILKKGGLLISDNVLQEGEIVQSKYGVTRRNRTIHERMREYVYMLTHSDEVVTSVVPIGDGITLSVKK